MDNKIIFTFTVLACSILFDKKVEANGIAQVMGGIVRCISEAPSDFQPVLCHEMTKEGNDNSQEKYKACKCVGSCVWKKLGIITEDGDLSKENLEKFGENISEPLWQEAHKALTTECVNVQGKDCELAYNLLECGAGKSPAIKSILNTLASV